MIAGCRWCGGRIRDCTAVTVSGEGTAYLSLGWYHTVTGREPCGENGCRAEPAPLADVTCGRHPHREIPECPFCLVTAEVSFMYHDEGRCIRGLCGWLHT